MTRGIGSFSERGTDGGQESGGLNHKPKWSQRSQKELVSLRARQYMKTSNTRTNGSEVVKFKVEARRPLLFSSISWLVYMFSQSR